MTGLPTTIIKAFPEIEPLGELDRLTLTRQIGRDPAGEIFIASRCPGGKPAVIVTMPAVRRDKGPQPPLLWLSCPSAARAAGSLESRGLIEEFGWRIDLNEGLKSTFQLEEDEFSQMLEAAALHSGGEELATRFRNRGAAGGVKYRVKCLHAHLAYFLAQRKGLLGEWCIEELGGPERVWCENVPPACVD